MPLYKSPKPLRMIHLAKVAKLVNEYVVEQLAHRVFGLLTNVPL